MGEHKGWFLYFALQHREGLEDCVVKQPSCFSDLRKDTWPYQGFWNQLFSLDQVGKFIIIKCRGLRRPLTEGMNQLQQGGHLQQAKKNNGLATGCQCSLNTTHPTHPVVSFPFCFSGKAVTSHLRFSWASWPAHPFLISYCFQSIRHMQPRLIFFKSKAWIMPFLCQETLKDYLSWKIKSKCLDSHSRPSVSIFLPNFISNSLIIYLLNPMLQSTCYSLNVAYLSCSLGIYNLIKEIIQKQK